MPAIAADLSGVHVAFYRVGAAGIALDAADSPDGTTFALSPVSTTTFPGSLNVPQFDPFVADGYMGDYVALVSDGASTPGATTATASSTASTRRAEPTPTCTSDTRNLRVCRIVPSCVRRRARNTVPGSRLPGQATRMADPWRLR